MSTQDQPIGKVLAGKYRIEGFLTQGGMGAVYRGTHEMLGRKVAIKLIKPELVTSDGVVERFLREARAASQLHHTNIVATYDLGQAEDGSLYIAMELVDGKSLKEVIKEAGPMDPERIVRLGKGIAAALALAHRNNIVHRDLKPQNIVVCKDHDGNEVPKLLDFGIAKTFEPDQAALTATGMVIGTPQYMAPEQAQGQDVDARTDLYALGVILYEMVGGHVPFRDTSVPALLVKHMQTPPPPLKDLRSDTPPGLEAIVLRCLEKDPNLRFPSADALSEALDKALDPSFAAETALSAAELPTRAVGGPGPSPPTSPPPPKGQPKAAPSVTRPTAPASPPVAGASPAPQAGSRGGLVLGVVVAVLILLIAAGLVAARFFGEEETPVTQASGGADPRGVTAGAIPRSADASTEGTADTGTADDSGTPNAVAAPATTLAAAAAPVTRSPASTAAAASEPVAAPAPPASTLPAVPRVSIECEGVADACASLTHALQSGFDGEGMPIASPRVADVFVGIRAEEIEARTENQFGTTFVVRTYSVEARAENARSGMMVAMPAPANFNFDARFGRDKLNEQSRVFASSVVEKVAAYWARQTQ